MLRLVLVAMIFTRSSNKSLERSIGFSKHKLSLLHPHANRTWARGDRGGASPLLSRGFWVPWGVLAVGFKREVRERCEEEKEGEGYGVGGLGFGEKGGR